MHLQLQRLGEWKDSAMSETHSETEPQERRGAYTLIKVTELTALKAELASCRECRANLDCLSRGQPKDTSK